MLTSLLEVVRTPVYVQNDDHQVPVAFVKDLLLDPDTGVIKAVWVRDIDGFCLVLPQSIVHWNEHELLIREPDDITNPEEVLPLKKFLEKEVSLLGLKVFGLDTQCYLGKLKNISFNSRYFKVSHIRMKKGFGPWAKQVIIPYEKIYQILPDRVTVYEMEPAEKMKSDLAKTIQPSKKIQSGL